MLLCYEQGARANRGLESHQTEIAVVGEEGDRGPDHPQRASPISRGCGGNGGWADKAMPLKRFVQCNHTHLAEGGPGACVIVLIRAARMLYNM
eukprot:scaffold60_cov382-Prasinococcus_capsulatus_cf.AAC.8